MLKPEQQKRRFTANDTIWWAAILTAGIAGLFSFIVSVLLIANYFQIQAITPLDSPQLLKMRQQLAVAPEKDENLVEQIRALDLLTRKAFFTSQAHLKMGGYLLLGSMAVFFVALRLAAKCKPRLPKPDTEPINALYWSFRSRSSEMIGLAAILWVIAALTAAYFTKLDFPNPAGATPVAAQAKVKTQAAYPDWETIQKNWPAFRGPGGYGVAFYTTAPTEWDGESGKNVKWKIEVPLPGANSPVVWDKRVFLSGATEETREVYCFDAETGQLLWKRTLDKFPGTPEKPPRIGDETGFAASTMAAQGDRICAIFANGDLACYDAEGNFKWGKNIGVPDNHYGHSSSLLAYENLLYVQYDQRKNSKLFAFDLSDGHEVWKADREKISWASPVCAPTPFGVELVLNSELHVDAYDPLTGKPLWQIKCLDGEVAPSPAYGGGMFFVANDNATATAIRFKPGEKTPIPEIAWQWDESLPDVSSPVGSDQHFYVTTSRAEIICLDMNTGKAAWTQETEEGFYASPIRVGERVYALDKKGITHIFKTGPVYESIGTASLNEAAMATPAFMDARIYFRTEKNLICIAKQE